MPPKTKAIPPISRRSGLLTDSIAAELRRAGDHARLAASGSAAEKKNFAEALSRALAQRFANALRGTFPGILPDARGKGQESRARTGKGLKKLDVNHSTAELGLALGVSVKTINFRDAKSKRYTKNFTRADNEFRAESADYHQRQPYAVLCGIFFLPLDACDDGGSDPSSFGQAVRIFRFRSGRRRAVDDPTLFERFLIGLYDTSLGSFGKVGFFDVEEAPPKNGRPSQLLSFEQCIDRIARTYDRRNRTSFVWADALPEAPFAQTLEDDLSDD
jgi:hypothetical protein